MTDMEGQMTAIPLFITVPRAAELLSVSGATVWRMVADGRLPSVKVGSLRRIPMAAITGYGSGEVPS